jgi:hypothetical protein
VPLNPASVKYPALFGFLALLVIYHTEEKGTYTRDQAVLTVKASRLLL